MMKLGFDIDQHLKALLSNLLNFFFLRVLIFYCLGLFFFKPP